MDIVCQVLWVFLLWCFRGGGPGQERHWQQVLRTTRSSVRIDQGHEETDPRLKIELQYACKASTVPLGNMEVCRACPHCRPSWGWRRGSWLSFIAAFGIAWSWNPVSVGPSQLQVERRDLRQLIVDQLSLYLIKFVYPFCVWRSKQSRDIENFNEKYLYSIWFDKYMTNM